MNKFVILLGLTSFLLASWNFPKNNIENSTQAGSTPTQKGELGGNWDAITPHPADAMTAEGPR